MLDLSYEEDSTADVDINIVMTENLDIIEVQGTGERRAYTIDELMKLIKIGEIGIKKLIEKEKEVLFQS